LRRRLVWHAAPWTVAARGTPPVRAVLGQAAARAGRRMIDGWEQIIRKRGVDLW